MSKKAYKAQASSSRAFSGGFDAFGGAGGAAGFGGSPQSQLSHVYEPPILTGLQDAQIVVAFKNLQKKVETTKSKALEDLQVYVQERSKSDTALEDEFLEAWTKVYPRTSIDNSRRVRLLAHTLQGHIASACGKRIARYLPQIVGSWLSGIYDLDKSIVRATQDSFRAVFPTEDKYRTVWKAYQPEIVAFIKNVVERETPQTLSDERVTSSDDANTKYDRTLGAVLQMTTFLIDEYSEDEMSKGAAELNDLLSSSDLWKLASASDPFVRRSLYRLLAICLRKRKAGLVPSTLSSSILTRGLSADQTGSIFDYAKVLAILSTEIPTVWTEHYHGTGKKSAHYRLCHFLRKGAQNGPADTWTYIGEVLTRVPDSVLIKQTDATTPNGAADEDGSFEIVHALHDGVKGESFSNSDAAWQVYLDLCARLCERMQGKILEKMLAESVFPMVQSYVKPSTNRAWVLPGSQGLQLCCKSWDLLRKFDQNLFESKWKTLSAQVREDVHVSLPEQSKDYVKSQETVVQETSRWYGLYSSMFEIGSSNTTENLLGSCMRSEIQSIMSLLKNRNGKPYGAASALLGAINASTSFLDSDTDLKNQLAVFANGEVPHLILSPSAPYLVRCLDSLQPICDVSQAVRSSLSILEQAQESSVKTETLKYLFLSPGLIALDGGITELAEKLLRHDLSGQIAEVKWDLVDSILTSHSLSKDTTDDILSHLTEELSLDTTQQNALNGFEHLADRHPRRLRGFSSSDRGTSLLTNLLLLAESADTDLSSRAESLSKGLEGAGLASDSATRSTNPSIALIQTSFRHVDPSSLSIDSLVRQADLVLGQLASTDDVFIIKDLLPTQEQWTTALAPHLARRPSPSLAACSSFGCAFSLVQTTLHRTTDIPSDANGQTLAIRIARYVVSICKNEGLVWRLTEEQKRCHAQQLAVLLELAGDDISARGLNPLSSSSKPGAEHDLVALVERGQHLLQSWILGPSTQNTAKDLREELLRASVGISSPSYYYARAYSMIARMLEEGYPQRTEAGDGRFKGVLKDTEPFRALAIVSADPFNADGLRICNEVLSKLTGRQLAKDQNQCLFSLILLDLQLQNNPDVLGDVPQQRIVFFAKHVIDQLPQCPLPVQIELLRVLKSLIHPIQDIYGGFWGDLLQYISQAMKIDLDEEGLALLCVTLQLCAHLQKLAAGEANDDLLDTWGEQRPSILAAAFELLLKMKDSPDQSHQPRRIINETLQRIIHRARDDMKFEPTELYAGLAAESIALQDTTYDLLQEAIPRKQEDLSLEKGIDPSFTATLPNELLSLIIAPPSLDDFAEMDLSRTLPTSLRSYLLSWKLTLLHWEKASVALQADYIKSLQEAGCISGFLDFATDILISSRHKPIDASRFAIDTYDPDNDDPPETDLDHLLIHLYYLIFLRLPSPAKTWWRDSTSRQTNIAVNSWTEKNISPIIAPVELSAVKEWAGATTTDSSDPALTVKVSLTTREITASIPIDDRMTMIAIRLPPAYPLARAEVIDVQRVGFAEQKWQTWIRNAQGQLTISDGGSNALIDCLLAWKRNVTAAMKGQTECAICYSVVGADKSLPKKECPTCKNRFHAGCLYRWFKSSNSSSCPLCRNTFAYS